jgi:hypothetical protein
MGLGGAVGAPPIPPKMQKGVISTGGREPLTIKLQKPYQIGQEHLHRRERTP